MNLTAIVALTIGTTRVTDIHTVYRQGEATIRFLGVCRITERTVVAWDADGKPLPTLAKSVKDGLIANSTELLMKPGRRIRYALFESTGAGSSQFFPERAPGAQGFFDTSEFRDRFGVLIDAPLDSNWGRVSFLRENGRQAVTEFRPTPGKRVSISGAICRLRSIRAGAPKEVKFPSYTAGRKTWTLTFDTAFPRPQEALGGIQWRALTANGLTVRSVDRAGISCPAPAWVRPDWYRFWNKRAGIDRGHVAAGTFTAFTAHQEDGHLLVTTNVNPTHIQTMRAISNSVDRVVFGGIPLDMTP